MGKQAVRGHDDATATTVDDWQQLYTKHAPRLHRVVARLVDDERLVADIVQETFLRAYRNRDRIEADVPIGPWLTAIARSVARDCVRHRVVVTDSFDRLLSEGGYVAAPIVPMRDEPGDVPTSGSVTLLSDEDEAYFSADELWEADSERSA